MPSTTRWLIVCGWTARFDAAALIDGHVHHHAAILHRREMLTVDKHRRLCSEKHRTDDKVSTHDTLFDIRWIGVEVSIRPSKTSSG